jgi:deoxyadenosine/deoxycytidine kinase
MKLVFDGNIGCGKSSILKLIQINKPIEMNIYNEPLYDWSKWLELFYSDMNKHSFGFQMRVLKSHLDKKDILNGIFERSPLSCQKVFGELLYEDNKMNELEWNLTNEFNYDYGWNPDYVVYLKCDPQICYQRIKQRNRNDEQSIDINYLERIHEKYEKLYTDCKSFKVITIDASNSIEKVYEDVMDLVIRKIRFSINRTSDFPLKSI